MHSPELVILAGITPLLAMTQSALSGFFAGVFMIFIMLATTVISYMARPWVPHTRKWLVIMLIAATMVGISERLLESLLPELHQIYGLYLPLLTMVPLCSILPAENAFNTGFIVAMTRTGRICLVYFPVIFLFGCLRELMVSGSLFTDSALILGGDYSFQLIPLSMAILSQVSGALLLAGLLLAMACNAGLKIR